MGLVNFFAILSVVLCFIFLRRITTDGTTDLNQNDTKIKYNVLFFCIISVAFLIRAVGAVMYFGYESDMNCFIGWADRLSKLGFRNFYSKEVFTDYPPGYMFILFILGKIRDVLQLDYYSNVYVFFIKLPAMICDLITGSLLFHIAKKHFNGKSALIIASFYLLNPAIIINSSIWGQVDSVFNLAIVLMVYLIYKERLPFAYFVYGIGILIKPQMLIFSPVLLYAIIDQVFLKEFSIKKFLKNLLTGLSAIALVFALASLFGLNQVVHQYTDTISSYPYASINAYNIWTMLGLNWAPQTGKILLLTYQQWGILFILFIVGASAFISFKLKENKSKYFYLSAFIITGIFSLSVRMHERYIFPALILLLFTYCIRPRKEIMYLFFLISLTHLYNVSHVLFVYDVNNFKVKATLPILIGIVMLAIFLYMIFYTWKVYGVEEDSYNNLNTDNNNLIKQKTSYHNRNNTKNNILTKIFVTNTKEMSERIKPSKIKIKLSKIDFIILSIITLIYAVIALHDLGNHKAPETAWETNQNKDEIIIDLGESKDIAKIEYYLGNYENRILGLEVSDTLEGPYMDMGSFTMEAVFRWGNYEANTTARYIRLISNSGNLSLKELVLLDKNGDKIIPVNINDDSDVKKLFDEQDLYPKRSTFRDSTYFDEIYHARTAYEYLQGLYSYENTHPPLGKIFIALGMAVFGVNPFGWRIMGTLFGIAMVPLIYIFAKKLLKETWLSTIVCILFAFDFMHFSQTRIATIDVYVTFFIILMYYFMYQYQSLSFYDTKLSKTFIPLGLCGISMGFGIACKWTGVYAAVGLAILFFMSMFQRFQEYRYACKEKSGSTNGILHQNIVTLFYPNMIRTILFCFLVFIIIPFIIYTLSYIPFRDGSDAGLISRMIKNQFSMFNYHSSVDATHPYSSWWYQWPIMYRPIWYYSGHISDTVSEGISAFGNPLVWWTGIPAFFYLVYNWIRRRDKIALTLCISYLAQYVPWFLVTRITFIYHYFPSVPFVTLMIGYSIKLIVAKHPKLKKIAYIYTAFAIILFIMFYPVLSGEAVNKEFVSIWLRWFDSWVLVS